MIELINGKKHGFTGQDKIYIGRYNRAYKLEKSPLANPFAIGKDGDRNQVIELYRQWLWRQIQSWQSTGKLNPAVESLLTISRSENVVLTCWCHPLPCHGDVIVRCIKWLTTSGLAAKQ